MDEEKRSCCKGMVYTFFLGTILGAGLAFLFTPVSGKDARRAITDQFDDLKEKMKKLEDKIHTISD